MVINGLDGKTLLLCNGKPMLISVFDMPTEHPNPTAATVKFLYAHAFRCAYKGCGRPLYRVDEQTGDRTLNSRVCHINARREGGPRWDPEQSEEDNRSKENLVLMCVEHASAIDEPANQDAYPSERLREWKAKQLEEYDQLRQGWRINTDMAREAIGVSFSDVGIAVKASTVNLGGEGGNAPGAGGGGGGAIGPRSHGGGGGHGGGHRVDDGEYTLPLSEDASRPRLMDQPVQNESQDPELKPGAGGGGAGAIGDGERAGDGGGGGETVTGVIDLDSPGKTAIEQVRVVVGQGAQGAHLPGQHGKDGEDTVMECLAADGTVLKTIRACGGSGGRSGSSYLPDDVAELTHEDIDGGFRLTTLMPVNAADCRDGLLFVLGGNWEQFDVPHIPIDAVWLVVCTARWRNLEGKAARGMFLSLIDPAGHETSCQTLIIPAEAPQHGSRHWIQKIGATFDKEGAWKLRVHSGEFLLSEVDVRVLVQH